MNRVLGSLVILGAAVNAIGCAGKPHYLNQDVKTVVVMVPSEMEAQQNECGIKMLPYLEQEIASRGYALIPREQVLAWYKSKGFNTPDEAEQVTTEDIAKHFKVEGVVWSKLTRWGKKTIGIYTEVGVTIQVFLHDKNRNELWKGEGQDEYAKSSRSLLGALVDTVVAQAFIDPEPYAPKAAARAVATLGLAGWDPEVVKQREEDAKKAGVGPPGSNPTPDPNAPK